MKSKILAVQLILICSFSVQAKDLNIISGLNQKCATLFDHERKSRIAPPFWFVMIPGNSEEWGHRKAPPRAVDPDGRVISREFQTRLDLALKLYAMGIVRFFIVSGGAVDTGRPDYIEAIRGRDYLLNSVQAKDPFFNRRIFLDPISATTVTNVRNSDRLVLSLGIKQYLIATTMPNKNRLSRTIIPGFGQYNQGWYLLNHTVSTFDLRCVSEIGYTLGAFSWQSFTDGNGVAITALRHDQFDNRNRRNNRILPKN